MEYKSENKDFKIEHIKYNLFSFECEKGHTFKRNVKDNNLSKVYCQRCFNYNKMFEKFKLLFKENDYELIYIGDVKVTVKCKNGHTFERSKLTLLNNKKACTICYSKENKINDFIQLQKENGINIVSIEDKLIKYECENCHSFYQKIFTSYKYIFKCKKCIDKNKTMIKYDKLFKKNEFELLSKNKRILTIKCKNGHIFDTYTNILKKYKKGCSRCNGYKLNIEEKIKLLKNLKLEYVSHKDNLFTVKCENGHIYTKDLFYLKSIYNHCQECRNINHIYNILGNKLKLNNIKIISTENKLTTCECENGHIFTKNKKQLLDCNYKCSECNKLKKGNNSLKKTLKKHNKNLISLEDNIIKWKCENGHINNTVKTARYSKKLICNEC